MADVFAIALLASLGAGLLAASVVLLTRPRPARQLLAFLIGGMGLSIGFGLLIVLLLHGSSFLRYPDDAVTGSNEVAVGALLLAVAVLMASGRTAEWKARRSRRHEEGVGARC